MVQSKSGVKRPFLYALAAALAIALAVPLAASSGQFAVGGIFDECYDAECTSTPVLASRD